MKPLTVGELKSTLSDLPDDMRVVLEAPDHEYADCRAIRVTALLKGRVLNMDYGEELTPEAEYGKRINVLVMEQ